MDVTNAPVEERAVVADLVENVTESKDKKTEEKAGQSKEAEGGEASDFGDNRKFLPRCKWVRSSNPPVRSPRDPEVPVVVLTTPSGERFYLDDPKHYPKPIVWEWEEDPSWEAPEEEFAAGSDWSSTEDVPNFADYDYDNENDYDDENNYGDEDEESVRDEPQSPDSGVFCDREVHVPEIKIGKAEDDYCDYAEDDLVGAYGEWKLE